MRSTKYQRCKFLTRLGLEPTIYWTCYYTTDEVKYFEEKNGHIVENLLIVIYQKNTWYVIQRQGIIIICLQKRDEYRHILLKFRPLTLMDVLRTIED